MAGKTEARKSLSEYITISDKVNAAALGAEYHDFIRAMRTLDQFTDVLYKEPCPIMGAEDLTALELMYERVFETARPLLEKGNMSKAERQYASVARNVSELVNKDLAFLRQMNVGADGMTLPQMVSLARVSRYKVTEGQKVQKVGNMLSARIPMKLGNRQGFFSKLTTIRSREDKMQECYDNGKAEAIRANPEYRDELTALFSIEKATAPEGELSFENLVMDYENGILNQKAITDFLKEKQVYQEGKDYTSSTFMTCILEFIGQMSESASLARDYIRDGAKPGETIEERNDAFFDMAKLFGLSSCVPKTNKTEVRFGDQTVVGSFMDTALGSDKSRLKENDPLYTWTVNAVEGPNGPSEPKIARGLMKRLADVQVMDFITGNIDRHSGNLLYRFDTSDPKNPVLSDVSCIDNDRSFHTKDVRDPSCDMGLQYTAPESLVYISQSMADRLAALREEDVRLALRGHSLSNEAIDAVWSRVQYMNEIIAKSKAHYAGRSDIRDVDEKMPRIVSDEEFNRLKLSEVKQLSPFTGIFRHVGNLCDSSLIRKYRTMEAAHSFSKSNINYLNTELVSLPEETMHEKVSRELREISEEMERNTPFFHRDSKDYRVMKKALKDLRTAMENSGSEKELFLQYNALDAACRNYVDAKDTLPSTDYGKRRLDLARRMRDLCTDRKDYIREREKEEAARRGFGKIEDYYRQRFAEKLFYTKYSIRRLYEDELGLQKDSGKIFQLRDEKTVRNDAIEGLKNHPAVSRLMKIYEPELLIHLPSQKAWDMVSQCNRDLQKNRQQQEKVIDRGGMKL